MAEARQAYQDELARHSDRLEEIRRNPKYDLILAGGRIPSGMADRDREAYARYRSSLDAGASRPEALMAAYYNRTWRNRGNGTGNSSWGYIPQGSAEWRDSMAFASLGSGGMLGVSGGMADLVRASARQFYDSGWSGQPSSYGNERLEAIGAKMLGY